MATCAGICAIVPATVRAETVAQTAAVFGERQSVLDASLSPSGNKLAYIAPAGSQGEALFVVDLVSGSAPQRAVLFDEAQSDLYSCEWVTDTRLACSAYVILRDSTIGEYLGFTRTFAVNEDGTDIDLIEAPRSMRTLGVNQNGGSILALDVEGEDRKILMTRSYQKEQTLNTRLASNESGLGVVEVDIETGKESPVESPDDNAVRYIADENGVVRIKGVQRTKSTGYLTDQLSYLYRSKGSQRWDELSRYEIDGMTGEGFWPVAVDTGRNVVYGFEKGQDGYEDVVSIGLDGSNARSIVLSYDGADVDSLIRIGRQRRVVGASYATEKRTVDYFDPALKALASSLGSTLSDTPLINFVGASADGSKLLLTASSDTHPGMLYLFDKEARQLNPLLPLRERTEGRQMAEMRPITFPAGDGTQIPGYLTLPHGSDGKNIPAIVLPHGGPGARDEWGFDWLVQFFAARGYAVLQPNFRGSTGYGEAWFGRNGVQAWKTAVGDVNDAGRWLVSQGIADPEKLAGVGWSYGGYAALQSQVLDPALFQAIVAIAPVTDFDQLLASGKKFSNYRLLEKFIGRGPHTSAGSPAQNVAQFAAPVLMFHGSVDQNVAIDQSRLFERRMRAANKNVTLVEFDGLAHDLGDSNARIQMLTRIDEFLSSSLAR